ncbi:kinase-like domain-containing protein [Lactifluus subvellereus]|nr:kinase-like domain-containing protein [Lactifluus subvellereus]
MQPTTKYSTQAGGNGAPQSLLDLVIRMGRLREREVRPLAQQLARTLSLLHTHGVVHRNLKLENILVGTGTGTGSTGTSTSTATTTTGRVILTDFTYAAASPVPAWERTLLAFCGEQYSPAPELFRSSAALAPVPYAGPPVDVWGLGLVLFPLVCGRVAFDGPTMDVLHKASLRSPAGLPFSKRVSRECRDLLRRMLQADPAARASLDEVLNHPWMSTKSASFRRHPTGGLPGADSGPPTHAALMWPDEIDHKKFRKHVALDSGNGDDSDARKCLTEALELVSRVCETRGDASRPGDFHPPSGARNPYAPSSLMSLLSRGIRELSGPRQPWSLFAKFRSRAAPDWASMFHFHTSGKGRAKAGTS